MPWHAYWSLRTLVVLAAALGVGGCGTRRVTDTPRTASEQLLLAAAVDQAVSQLDFSPLAERLVYIDGALIERTDQSFLLATVRARAWVEGVRVVAEPDEADYILELRSGTVGVNRNEYVLGIPASELPTPFGAAPIPEAALFKSTNQAGASRVSFVVYRRDDRRLMYASGPTYGFSHEKAWWVLGAGPTIRDNVKPPPREENTASVSDPLRPSVPSPAGEDPDKEPPPPVAED